MINKEDLKDLLSFSKGERNGIFILLSFIFILAIYGYYKNHYTQAAASVDPEFKEQVLAFLEQSELEKEKSTNLSFKKDSKLSEIQPFLFDPNSISLAQWMELGLSDKQAKVVLNYRDKGGVFRVKKDVQKMYTVSDEIYAIWEPFIQLPEVVEKSKKEYPKSNYSDKPKEYNKGYKESYKKVYKEDWKKEKEAWVQVNPELNSTDTTELKKLKGVGSFYARKIVEYRDELGGFISINQLEEIWKMRPETIEAIRPFITIDKDKIKGIKINVVDLEKLKSHPYVDYKKASLILNYRDQHGDFTSIEDLKKIIALDKDWINKIQPYLSYD